TAPRYRVCESAAASRRRSASSRRFPGTAGAPPLVLGVDLLQLGVRGGELFVGDRPVLLLKPVGQLDEQVAVALLPDGLGDVGGDAPLGRGVADLLEKLFRDRHGYLLR